MKQWLNKLLLCIFAILLITGCSTNQRARDIVGNDISHWHGRIAVTVASSDNPHAAGTRSFSATFELHGNSETGQLTLFNPFGTTAASINWQPGSAELSAPGMSRKNGNLATLMQQQFGTELPMQALFAWLQGKKADVDSWRVDLSRWQEGKISALREVDPQVHVRLILEP